MEENKTIAEIESKTQTQIIGEVAAELKKTFGIVAQDVQKLTRLIVLSFRKSVELTAFEIRKRYILKKLEKEEESIKARYKEQTLEVLQGKKPRRKTRAKVIEFVIIMAVSLVLFNLASIEAYNERGYKAYGGEYFLLLLPAFYYLTKATAKDFKKAVQESRKKE